MIAKRKQLGVIRCKVDKQDAKQFAFVHFLNYVITIIVSLTGPSQTTHVLISYEEKQDWRKIF